MCCGSKIAGSKIDLSSDTIESSLVERSSIRWFMQPARLQAHERVCALSSVTGFVLRRKHLVRSLAESQASTCRHTPGTGAHANAVCMQTLSVCKRCICGSQEELPRLSHTCCTCRQPPGDLAARERTEVKRSRRLALAALTAVMLASATATAQKHRRSQAQACAPAATSTCVGSSCC